MAPTREVPRALEERIAENEKRLAVRQAGGDPDAAPPATSGPASPAQSGTKPGESLEEANKRLSQSLRVLQGKYNKEIPHLMKENDQLKKELVITDADRERADNWGVDPEEIAAFKADIVNTVRGGEGDPQAGGSKREVYFETLDALCGGHEQRMAIMNDPKFVEFLALIDKGTGRLIRDIAVEADKNCDSGTMADIYQAFGTWTGKGADTTQGPIYTHAQYDEFKRRVKRGDFHTHGKNAPWADKILAEYKQLSDQFETALKEGRIRG